MFLRNFNKEMRLLELKHLLIASANIEEGSKTFEEAFKSIDKISQPSFWQSFDWNNLGKKFILAILIFIIGRFIIKFLIGTLDKIAAKQGVSLGIRYFIRRAMEFILYFILISILASSLGAETNSLAAIIGSLGIALALALRDSISDVASGIIMVVIRSIKSGDFVILKEDTELLQVKEIRLFNTIFRNRNNMMVILPNTNIVQNKIKNLSRGGEYVLVDVRVSVAYKSDLKKVKDTISKVVEEEDLILKGIDYIVGVDKLADSGVDILVSAPVIPKDYFKARLALTESIKVALDKAGIEIPFPQIEMNLVNKKEDK